MLEIEWDILSFPEMTTFFKKKRGLDRLWAAMFFSSMGLKRAISHETAFRQEAVLIFLLTIALCFLPLSLIWKCILIFPTFSILIVELINSAIESVVDLASPEYHDLAKYAKDFGSAAVFINILVAVLLWTVALSTLV